jgi:hypothetical protein
LRSTTTPKTHLNAINEVLNCKIREFVLTWSKKKSVSSTVAPEIMIFGKRGSFGSRINFQISNGDNELPTSIYRLFGLFLSLFWAPLSVSLYQKPFRVIQELYGRDLIRYWDNFY